MHHTMRRIAVRFLGNETFTLTPHCGKRTGKKVKRNATHEPALILSVTVLSQNGLSVMREIPIGNLRTSGTAPLIRKWYQRNVRISQVIDNHVKDYRERV